MANKPFEWDSPPDEGDTKKPDFRDDLITLKEDEILAKYTFYQFLDLQVGLVIDENENNFEAGFPDGSIRIYNKDIKDYAIPNHQEKRDFIEKARQHRLEEIVNEGS